MEAWARGLGKLSRECAEFRTLPRQRLYVEGFTHHFVEVEGVQWAGPQTAFNIARVYGP